MKYFCLWSISIVTDGITPVRYRLLSTVATLILSIRGRRPAARRQEPDPGTSSSVEARFSSLLSSPAVTSSTCHDVLYKNNNFITNNYIILYSPCLRQTHSCHTHGCFYPRGVVVGPPPSHPSHTSTRFSECTRLLSLSRWWKRGPGWSKRY